MRKLHQPTTTSHLKMGKKMTSFCPFSEFLPTKPSASRSLAEKHLAPEAGIWRGKWLQICWYTESLVNVTISKPNFYQCHSWLSKPFPPLNSNAKFIEFEGAGSRNGLESNDTLQLRTNWIFCTPPNHNTDLPHRLWPRLKNTAVKGKCLTTSWVTAHHGPHCLGSGWWSRSPTPRP